MLISIANHVFREGHVMEVVQVHLVRVAVNRAFEHKVGDCGIAGARAELSLDDGGFARISAQRDVGRRTATSGHPATIRIGATANPDGVARPDLATSTGESSREVPGRRHGSRIAATAGRGHEVADRKSTRLNSSHVKIAYAVFCLKK